MFQLYLSNRKKMRKSATDTGEPGDPTVSFRARSINRRDPNRETLRSTSARGRETGVIQYIY
jgi:hypothetical protein